MRLSPRLRRLRARPIALIADKAMPPVVVEKASDYYYEHDVDDLFEVPEQTVVAPGANVPEISPRQSKTQFVTVPRAMATFLPTEVEGNGDAALILAQRYMQLPMTKLLIQREVRVATALRAAGAYAAANKITLAAGEKWNGGATSDLINLQQLCDESLMPITGIYMSQRTYSAFVQNPRCKNTSHSKTWVPKPKVENANELSGAARAPPFIVGRQKYKNPATGLREFIWGNDVVLAPSFAASRCWFARVGVHLPLCRWFAERLNGQMSRALQQLTFANGWACARFTTLAAVPKAVVKVIVFTKTRNKSSTRRWLVSSSALGSDRRVRPWAHTLTRANSKQPHTNHVRRDLRRQSNDVDDQHGRGRPSHSPGRGARKLLPLGFTYPSTRRLTGLSNMRRFVCRCNGIHVAAGVRPDVRRDREGVAIPRSACHDDAHSSGKQRLPDVAQVTPRKTLAALCRQRGRFLSAMGRAIF